MFGWRAPSNHLLEGAMSAKCIPIEELSCCFGVLVWHNYCLNVFGHAVNVNNNVFVSRCIDLKGANHVNAHFITFLKLAQQRAA